MNAVALLVRRPYFAIAVVLLSVVVAAMSFPRAPVSLYPNVARPAISVSCTYPGANAREVMNTVAGPIEEKVNGVEGMSRMTSSCSDTGAYSLTVYFHVGVDRDMALTKVQSKVQQALSLLPQEVKNTGVTVESGSTEELGLLTLRSAGGKLAREQVVDYAYGVVNPAILRVPGVGSSTVKDNKVAMRIWLDANKMAAHGIASDEVVSAIKSQNVQASLGSVGASPTEEPGCRVVSLISRGRLDAAEEFEKIVVRTEGGGGLVRLGDIARVDKGLQGYSYSALYDETPAVFIRIVQLPGVDVRKTMKLIKAELKKLEPSFPGDLAWDMTYDTTLYMDAALGSVFRSLALAFALAVVVAALFLRSARWALIVAAASAVPLAIAFAVMVAAGCFLSLVSLYAFIVAVGVSVSFSAFMASRIRALAGEGTETGASEAVQQPATSCQHSVGRGRESSQLAAAVSAAVRYAPPVCAAAVAIALAMVPVAMVDGLQGVVYRQFSLVLAAAALASALAAVVVVPAFAAAFPVRAKMRVHQSAARQMPLAPAVLYVALSACAVAAWGIGKGLPGEFIPAEDIGEIVVDCKMAEGTSMPVTADVMRGIYRKVRGIDGIEKSTTLLGESIVSGYGENNAKMYLVLKDWAKRGKSMFEIAREVEKAVADVPEAQVFTICPPPVQGQGNQGGLTVLVQSMEDADPVRFANEMQKFRAALARSPLAADANCGTVADVPHLRVHVDREKCEMLQVPMLSLYTTLQHALGSVYVNDVNLGTQVNRVTVMSDWSARSSADRVGDLYVRSKTGDMVPVSALVTFSEELGVRDCYRCNQYLYATCQFLPKKGVASSEAIKEVRRISAESLPRGYVQDWSGLIYEQFQSRGDTGLLMGLSVLAVYLVLMVMSGSLVRPLACLAPAAAATLGAVALHLVTGVPMSLYSQFSVLLLVVVCSALAVLADPRDGMAGRAFLPLLIAVSFLPLALSSGAGGAGSRSMGVALLGGFAFFALLRMLGAGRDFCRK